MILTFYLFADYVATAGMMTYTDTTVSRLATDVCCTCQKSMKLLKIKLFILQFNDNSINSYCCLFACPFCQSERSYFWSLAVSCIL